MYSALSSAIAPFAQNDGEGNKVIVRHLVANFLGMAHEGQHLLEVRLDPKDGKRAEDEIIVIVD